MEKRKKKMVLGLALGGIIVLVAAWFIFVRGTDPTKILSRADGYFAAEQYDNARIEYRNLLMEQRDNPYAFQQIGFGFLEQGLTLRAIPFLAKSLELSPSNPEAQRKLGSAIFSLGDPGGASKLALEVLDQEPTDEDAILLLANATQPMQEDGVAEIEKRLANFDEQKQAVVYLVKAILASRTGGDIEETRALLDRALAIEPESVAVHLARATFSQATRDKEMLNESLAAAAKASPTRSTARVRYAAFLAKSGEVEKGEAQLTELTGKAPDYTPAWIGLAEIAASREDYKEALEHLDKVIQKDPVNYAAQMARAQILLAQKDVEGVTALLTKLDEAYRDGIPVHRIRVKLTLARIYAQTGELDKAASLLEESVLIIPGLPEPILALAQVNLRKGSAAEAIAPLEALLEKAPNIGQAEMLLAQAYRAEGRLDDAANIFRNQIKRDPTKSGSHFLLGTMLRGLKRQDEARVAFEKAQELAPRDQAITFQLISMDFEKKDFESAHRRVQVHLDAEGGDQDWGARYLQGQVYFAEKKWTEAEKVLLKALELKPESLSVYNLLIDTYIASENQPRAISQLEDLLESNPKSERHRMLLALLHEKEKNFPSSAEAYGQLLVDNPDFIPALNNLAYLNSEVFNDLDKAHTLASRAHELAPNDAGIADTLGWILYKKQDYRQALTLLEEAGNLSPDQPEIQYHLGMTRAQMGQSDAARTALQKATASEIEFRGKDEAVERLAQLGGSVEKKTVSQLEAEVAARPDDLFARTQLGLLYETEGNHAKAVATFEAALDANPELLTPLIGLARLYSGPLKESGDSSAKALGFAERARSVAPGNPQADGVRALVALELGEFEFAYGLLKSALRNEEAASDPLFQMALGQAAYGYGRVDEARRWMSKLVDAASSSSPDEKATASSFLALTAPKPVDEKALQELALERLSKHAEELPALITLASLKASADEQEGAKAYQEILESVENSVLAQRDLAEIYARNPSRHEEALALTQKVANALPDDPTNMQTRGILSYHMDTNDASFAIQLLKSVDQSKALEPEGLFYLGMAYMKEDQRDAGIEALQRALQAGLPEPLSEKAKAVIAEAN